MPFIQIDCAAVGDRAIADSTNTQNQAYSIITLAKKDIHTSTRSLLCNISFECEAVFVFSFSSFARSNLMSPLPASLAIPIDFCSYIVRLFAHTHLTRLVAKKNNEQTMNEEIPFPLLRLWIWAKTNKNWSAKQSQFTTSIKHYFIKVIENVSNYDLKLIQIIRL